MSLRELTNERICWCAVENYRQFVVVQAEAALVSLSRLEQER